MEENEWSVTDVTDAEGPWDIEFKDDAGEWHHFTLLATPERLVFGGACNVGFIESGYMLREDVMHLDEQLQELYQQLEDYYNKGPEAAPDLICNQRM
jgi:hypothetical protein